mmetsp:Transcript_27906/g.61788  ORF Transcript_27906/g.61788 Transcript_27906/m.61788 type:complete len:264 (-) Transcript_27906:207-998(-)
MHQRKEGPKVCPSASAATDKKTLVRMDKRQRQRLQRLLRLLVHTICRHRCLNYLHLGCRELFPVPLGRQAFRPDTGKGGPVQRQDVQADRLCHPPDLSVTPFHQSELQDRGGFAFYVAGQGAGRYVFCHAAPAHAPVSVPLHGGGYNHTRFQFLYLLVRGGPIQLHSVVFLFPTALIQHRIIDPPVRCQQDQPRTVLVQTPHGEQPLRQEVEAALGDDIGRVGFIRRARNACRFPVLYVQKLALLVHRCGRLGLGLGGALPVL